MPWSGSRARFGFHVLDTRPRYISRTNIPQASRMLQSRWCSRGNDYSHGITCKTRAARVSRVWTRTAVVSKAKLHGHSRKYARRNGTPSKHRPNKNQESNHGKREVMGIKPGCRERSNLTPHQPTAFVSRSVQRMKRSHSSAYAQMYPSRDLSELSWVS